MTIETVEKLIKDYKVEFVDLRFADMRGVQHHVTFPASIVDESLFEDGRMFDGSSISGWRGIQNSDMVLLPDAVIDDGLLDVLALRAKGVLGWTRAVYVLAEHTFLHRLPAIRKRVDALGRERHETRPLDFLQGNTMQATVLEKPAPFQIDGEDAGDVTEFSARIKRRGLTVRVGI